MSGVRETTTTTKRSTYRQPTPYKEKLRKDNLPQVNNEPDPFAPIKIQKEKTTTDKSKRKKPKETPKHRSKPLCTKTSLILFLLLVMVSAAYFLSLTSKYDPNSKPYKDIISFFDDFNLNPVSEFIIRDQIDQVNQRIDSILSEEMQRVSGDVQREYRENLQQFQQKINDLRNIIEQSRPTKDVLDQLKLQLDRMEALLPKTQAQQGNLQLEMSRLRDDLSKLQQSIPRYEELQLIARQTQEKSDSFHKDLAQRLANLRSNLDEQASKFVLSSEHQAYVDEFSASLLATESKLEKQIQEKLKEVQNQQGSFVTKDQAMQIINSMLNKGEIKPMTEVQLLEIIQRQFQDRKPPSPEEVFESQKHVISQWIDDALRDWKLPDSQIVHLKDGVSSDVLATIKRLVYEDGISKPDYALSALGAKVIDSSPTAAFAGAEPPSIVLQPGNTVGQCWPFSGAQGWISIKLAKSIYPESISIDHISSTIAHVKDTSSAPKEFIVWGYDEANNPVLLGNFTYTLHGEVVQNFPVSEKAKQNKIKSVKIEFTANHGYSSFTCIYRIRVHGNPENVIGK